MFAEKIYISILFHLSFLFVQLSSVQTGTSFGQHLKMFERLCFVLLKDKAHSVINEYSLVSSDVYFVSFPFVWTAGA